MAKLVKLDPINQEAFIPTNDNIMSAIIAKELNVLKECGGRGLCATCHVYIKEGMDSLSPMSRREQRTLEVVTSSRTNSRLACQARVIGECVVVELPSGTYLNQIEDVESMIGKRAEQDILHPITGQVLVEAGKLITRSMISKIEETQTQVTEYLHKNQ
jgi:ferredoxin